MNLETLNNEFEEHRRNKLLEIFKNELLHFGDNDDEKEHLIRNILEKDRNVSIEVMVLTAYWLEIDIGVLGFEYPYDEFSKKYLSAFRTRLTIPEDKRLFIKSRKRLFKVIVILISKPEKLVDIIRVVGSKYKSLTKNRLWELDSKLNFNISYDYHYEILDPYESLGKLTYMDKVLIFLNIIELGPYSPYDLDFFESLANLI